ncbi:hypothetical protein YC2023_038780 [Brassica napus]
MGSGKMKKGNVKSMASRIAKGVKKNQRNGAGLDDVAEKRSLIELKAWKTDVARGREVPSKGKNFDCYKKITCPNTQIL